METGRIEASDHLQAANVDELYDGRRIHHGKQGTLRGESHRTGGIRHPLPRDRMDSFPGTCPPEAVLRTRARHEESSIGAEGNRRAVRNRKVSTMHTVPPSPDLDSGTAPGPARHPGVVGADRNVRSPPLLT